MTIGRLTRALILALLAAGLVGCGAAIPLGVAGTGQGLAAQGAATDYFPLRASTRWTYRVEDKLNRLYGERSVVVRDYRDGQSAKLVYFADGQEISRQEVTKTSTALTWDAYGLSLDLTRLDKPGRLSEKQGRIIDHLGFETIVTPAGRFERCLKVAIQVNERMGRAGQEFRKVDTLWLAPGVGPVKRVYEEGYTDPKVGGWGKDLIVSVLSEYHR